jgi:hypothetical protein
MFAQKPLFKAFSCAIDEFIDHQRTKIGVSARYSFGDDC